MPYRAVGNRCAAVLRELDVPLSDGRIIEVLSDLGFRVKPVSIVDRARSRIGRSKFRAGASTSRAPSYVDCSSFTWWLYAQLGIALPRRSFEQRDFGERVEPGQERAGDLVFIPSSFGPEPGQIGARTHVGLVTGEETVVHASGKRMVVEEMSLVRFLGRRGEEEPAAEQVFRRYAPLDRLVTFVVPPGSDVKTSDDLRWLLSSKVRK